MAVWCVGVVGGVGFLGKVLIMTVLFVTGLAIFTKGPNSGLVCGTRRMGKMIISRAVFGVRNAVLAGCVGRGCGCSTGGRHARSRTRG